MTRRLEQNETRTFISRSNGQYNVQFMEHVYSSRSRKSCGVRQRVFVAGQDMHDKEHRNQGKDETSASTSSRKSLVQGR